MEALLERIRDLEDAIRTGETEDPSHLNEAFYEYIEAHGFIKFEDLTDDQFHEIQYFLKERPSFYIRNTHLYEYDDHSDHGEYKDMFHPDDTSFDTDTWKKIEEGSTSVAWIDRREPYKWGTAVGIIRTIFQVDIYRNK